MQKNWKSFLWVNENKREPFEFLTQCSHKDADTHLLPHTPFGVGAKFQDLAIH